MKRFSAIAVLAGLGLGGVLLAAGEPASTVLVYDVVQCKGKLVLEEEGIDARRLEAGDRVRAGDHLRTGWWSKAELHVASHASRFLLGPRTRCTLAGNRPGVLLHVERGRVRGVFEAFTDGDSRSVTTPSAVLAVRGTQYGVEVAKNGETHLIVFSGEVEILDEAGAWAPVRVEAGHQTRIGIGRPPEAPTAHRVTVDDWDRGQSRASSDMGNGPDRALSDAARDSGSPQGPSRRGGSNRRGG